MSSYQAVFYRDPEGTEPVRVFLDELHPRARAALDNQIDRLNLLNDSLPHLPFPHSSQVDGELRELRCHFGKDHYRILYAKTRRLLVLLHIFRKQTAKVAATDIAIAKQRRADLRERMDRVPRTPPRALGRDAP